MYDITWLLQKCEISQNVFYFELEGVFVTLGLLSGDCWLPLVFNLPMIFYYLDFLSDAVPWVCLYITHYIWKVVSFMLWLSFGTMLLFLMSMLS